MVSACLLCIADSIAICDKQLTLLVMCLKDVEFKGFATREEAAAGLTRIENKKLKQNRRFTLKFEQLIACFIYIIFTYQKKG